MSPGDLVEDRWDRPEKAEFGLVLRVIRKVEVSPLIEVLWENGNITRCCRHDIKVVRQ